MFSAMIHYYPGHHATNGATDNPSDFLIFLAIIGLVAAFYIAVFIAFRIATIYSDPYAIEMRRDSRERKRAAKVLSKAEKKELNKKETPHTHAA